VHNDRSYIAQMGCESFTGIGLGARCAGPHAVQDQARPLIGQVLGISAEAARQMARRRKWPRRLTAIPTISEVVALFGTEPDSVPGVCVSNCGPTDVPEPGTLALIGSALLGFGLLRRRKRA
jgi:hypothetical protein